MRRPVGSSRLKWANVVALLLDGPITDVGAAELIGCHKDTVLSILVTMQEVGIAHITSRRINPHGISTAIWSLKMPGEARIAA